MRPDRNFFLGGFFYLPPHCLGSQRAGSADSKDTLWVFISSAADTDVSWLNEMCVLWTMNEDVSAPCILNQRFIDFFWPLVMLLSNVFFLFFLLFCSANLLWSRSHIPESTQRHLMVTFSKGMQQYPPKGSQCKEFKIIFFFLEIPLLRLFSWARIKLKWWKTADEKYLYTKVEHSIEPVFVLYSGIVIESHTIDTYIKLHS